MFFKKKKAQSPTETPLSQEELSALHADIIADLRRKKSSLIQENCDLGKLWVNKTKNFLVAISVYSFIITLLAIKHHPVFLADLRDFGLAIKELVVSLFELTLSVAAFLGEYINMIPNGVISAILNLLVIGILFAAAAFIVLFILTGIIISSYMLYTFELHDSVTVGFMLITLAPCVLFAEQISALTSINLIALYIGVDIIYIVIRKLINRIKEKKMQEPAAKQTIHDNNIEMH